MAILKHIASKNANYGSAIDYLKYQHDEFHLVPVLDENGNMMLRDEFYLEGLNCDPETFDLECELLNQEYNKNNTHFQSHPKAKTASVSCGSFHTIRWLFVSLTACTAAYHFLVQ